MPTPTPGHAAARPMTASSAARPPAAAVKPTPT